MVKDEFYTKDQDVEEGGSSRIGVNDFDFIRVIGRGSYAKVMMVGARSLLIFHFVSIVSLSLYASDVMSVCWGTEKRWMDQEDKSSIFYVSQLENNVYSCSLKQVVRAVRIVKYA